MRRLALTIVAAFALTPALTACNTASQVPSPATISDKTTADEISGTTLTLAYVAAAKSAALAIRTGLIKDPATIKRIGELDGQAYGLVKAVRAAYESANSASYEAALAKANEAIAQLAAFTEKL